MRQVPPSYLVIGSGRMAKHFCHYLSLLALPYKQWARKSHSETTLHSLVLESTHIILLISDSQIFDFAQKLTLNSEQTIVHFSGQLSLDTVHSAHPLGTFTQQLYDKKTYESIPFILTQNGPPFSTLLPGLSNQFYPIPKELKAFYHALCVLSANFTCILWQKFFDELEKTLKLPASVGMPYLNQTLNNLLSHPQAALTGPLARKDSNTIQANLDALKNDQFLPIYQAFVNLFIPSRG